MEKRNFIFITHKGEVLYRRSHDTSLIQSLPRSGDEVYDTTQLNETMPRHPISGIVHRVAFDYISNSINIYIKVD